MRILYLTQYFPPENGATQIRAYEMGSNLVRLGHRVTIITEVPNHPSGIVPQAYRQKIYHRDNMAGIDVIRVRVKTSRYKNLFNRLFFYLSYMVNAILAGFFLARGKYDVIFATSPPLFTGGAGLVLSVIKRIPLVFEVRDLWPESAIALGELSNPTMIKLATRLEEACYRRATNIVVVTKGIYNRLAQRGIDPDKIYLIPNGSNIDHFQYNGEKKEDLRRKLGIEGKFIAAYIGTIGIAYYFEQIFDAARGLLEYPHIHFLIVGEGPRKREIDSLAKQLELPNLTILPDQSYEDIPDYYSLADVILIPLRKNELFIGTLPVKMFDAWACRRPVILSNLNGEANQLIIENQAGIVIPPEDSPALIQAIRTLQDSPSMREEMGLKGREYIVQHASRRKLAEQLAAILDASR